MATVYSDQIVKVRAGRDLNPNDWHGKVRIIEWEFASLPAGNVGDILVLGRLQANERVLLGSMVHTAGGAGTFDIGTYAINADGSLGAVITQAAFAAALSGATTTVEAFPQATVLAAAGGRIVATVDVYIAILNITTAFTTAARFSGFLLVVGD
jgi:hypothetical protein